MLRLNKRGGLTTDREALHASPGYRQQVEALAKLRKRGDKMSAMTFTIEQVRDWHRECASHAKGNAAMADAIDAHLTAHAQMVEKVREVMDGLKLIAGTDGSEVASPRAKAAELMGKLAAAIGDAK